MKRLLPLLFVLAGCASLKEMTNSNLTHYVASVERCPQEQIQIEPWENNDPIHLTACGKPRVYNFVWTSKHDGHWMDVTPRD